MNKKRKHGKTFGHTDNRSFERLSKRRKITIEKTKKDLFSGKSFVFIGKFKNKNCDKTKNCLKQLVSKHGGKNVTSISSKTDYVIFPSVITNSERNNKQTKRIPTIYSSTISFVDYTWLVDSIEKKKILPVKCYRLAEFHKKLPSFAEYFNITMTRDSFYDDKISQDAKIWKEHQDRNNNIYYYNTLNNGSTKIPCEDFKRRLIGGCSITEADYTTESTGIRIKEDLTRNINQIKKCQDMLATYENNLYE